jgi:surfactin synthase thioesterase subunit
LEDEEETAELVRSWESRTSRKFSNWTLPGNHFFLHTAEDVLFTMLARELGSIVKHLA